MNPKSFQPVIIEISRNPRQQDGKMKKTIKIQWEEDLYRRLRESAKEGKTEKRKKPRLNQGEGD